MKQPKIYTATQFAEKYNLSRQTVWRWLKDKKQERKLKMYDAKKIIIADKPFIEVI